MMAHLVLRLRGQLPRAPHLLVRPSDLTRGHRRLERLAPGVEGLPQQLKADSPAKSSRKSWRNIKFAWIFTAVLTCLHPDIAIVIVMVMVLV